MKKMFMAVAAFTMLLCGCVDTSDLESKVDDLDKRVTTLEEKVKELNDVTIPGMQSIVAAIQGNVYVTSVTTTTDGYVIKFSNNTTATIANGKDGANGEDGEDGAKGDKGDTPAISVVEIDGEFYWAVDGEPLLDKDGNKVPVHSALPQLRISEGKWQVSYDEGVTWADVEVLGEAGGSTISIEDGDTTVTFYINGEAYEIQKETAFFLVFESRKDLGVPQGDEFMFPYTIEGVVEGDEVEVDVLNCTAGWEARVVSLPKGETEGYIAVKNVDNKDGKVFIYAANGRGKTDIKSLVFEGGVLTATADVMDVPAAGGEVQISVTTNMGYELYVDRTQEWITVAPETRATHTDVYTLVCEANEAGSYRSAEVDVINEQTGETPSVFVILQYPAETVVTDIASLENVADGKTVSLYGETVLASSENSAVVSDGTSYMYLTNASAALPVGKVVSLTGVKRTAEDGSVYLELASFEVTGATSDVTDPATTYYGLGQNEGFLPMYTSVTGPLASEDGQYVVSAVKGQKVVLEAPTSNYAVASYVGKTVTVYGYLTTVVFPEGEEFETYTMVINAAEPVVFKENAAWTLSYAYDPSFDPESPEVVTNTVSGSTVPYQLGILSVEEYAEFNNDPESLAANLADDMQFTYWYYERMGLERDFIYSVLVHADGATDSEGFEELPYGSYYIFAVGLNPDGTVTGDYKVQEIEKVDPTIPAEYGDFIGDWIFNGSVISVIEKVNGESYTITGLANGLNGGINDIEALYDSESKKMQIKEQTLGSWEHQTLGEVNDYLSGIFVYGSKEWPNFPINESEAQIAVIFGLQPDGTLVARGGESQENGKFIAVRLIFAAGTSAGRYAQISLPQTLIKAEKPTDDYLKWVGTWNIERPEYDESTKQPTGNMLKDTWVITEAIPNKTYSVSGIEDIADSYGVAVADFNEDGTMSVKSQLMTTWNYQNQTVSEYLLPMFMVEGSQYYSKTLGVNMFTASLEGNSASLTPAKINMNGTGYDVNYIRHYQELGGTYYIHNYGGTPIPNTLVRSNSTESQSYKMTKVKTVTGKTANDVKALTIPNHSSGIQNLKAPAAKIVDARISKAAAAKLAK